MSDTVICHLQIQPEHHAEVAQAIAAQLAAPAPVDGGRRSARIFQAAGDPHYLLYVGEWSSREAFEAYRRQAPAPGRPGQLAEQSPCRWFRRLASFERVLVPVRDVVAVIVDGPAATHARRREIALAFHRASPHRRSGVSLFVLHEAVDAPPALLILAGWEARPTTAGHPAPEQILTDRLRAAGGRPSQFVGHALAEAGE